MPSDFFSRIPKSWFLITPLFLIVGFFVIYSFVPEIIQPIDKLKVKIFYPPKPVTYNQASNTAVLSASTGKVEYVEDYTILLLGDSMTERLGNCDELRGYLMQKYPNKTFEILNYGYGSTSILSVEQIMLEETQHLGRQFRPVTSVDFDLILIESFGNNPLSQFPLEEGLRVQNQTMDRLLQILKEKNPNSNVAFVATIAPNKEKFGLNSVDLKPDVRRKWAEERMAYIKNHIKYAKDHQIPVIDVYSQSLDLFGDGKLTYIDDQDFIHPSPTGIIFISNAIANGIKEQNLLQ